MDTQKIKQLLTLIANKSKSQTDYGNTKKYIMEIIDYHDSIVSIDVNDVRDLSRAIYCKTKNRKYDIESDFLP
jgi:hypothetical protein